MSITYSGGVLVALGVQHAKRMRPIVICGLALHYISRYLINGTIFDKNNY